MPSEIRSTRQRLSTGFEMQILEVGEIDAFPVLLIHGYGGSSDTFCHILDRPPPLFRFVVPDLRGHGFSDRPDAPYTMKAFADDCFALMDGLGINKAVLAGHSMGGLIIQNMVQRVPERVAGLGLISTIASPMKNASLRELQRQIDLLTDPVGQAFVDSFQTAPLPPFNLNRLIKANLATPAFVWKRALESLIASDYTAFLPEIKCPVSVFWGESDAFFSREEQTLFLQKIPHAVSHIYKGGHVAHAEVPDIFQRDLVAFLNAAKPREIGKDHA